MTLKAKLYLALWRIRENIRNPNPGQPNDPDKAWEIADSTIHWVNSNNYEVMRESFGLDSLEDAMVSIIIPAYKTAPWIAQTIESCLAQTYKNREIIVVNDGSPDECRLIALRYPVRVIDQSNKGLAGARNAGIMNSQGEYILPLDSDDYIDPTYLEKTVPLMTQGIGIVTTDFQCFGENDNYVTTRAEHITLANEMNGNYLPVCSLIRKKAILETGGYNQHCIKYEDWNMWIDLLKRGWGVKVVNEPLFHYRVRTGSMVTACTPDEHKRLYEVIKTLHPDLY